MSEEKKCCCCCHHEEKPAETKEVEKSCCCSKEDEAFLASLDENLRALILDPSTAPELVNTGDEVFAQLEKHELTDWAKGCWELHKEMINTTIEEGWDNGTHPWNRDMQDFWKYPIAFSAYGIPSLIMIRPDMYDEACDILRKSLLLLKEAGAYDEWTRLEFNKDPVTDKNVMYKGHLNFVYGLYQLISGSREFEEEYKNMTHIITTEMKRNARNNGFWGIECEPDQYFPPCNSICLLSLKTYDLNFGTNYSEELCEPTAEFIRNRMVEKETGMTFFRYHPSVDFAEPYITSDLAWTNSTFHYFSKEQTEKSFESTKRMMISDIKGGKECYMKANRNTEGASTDYEQSTMALYMPLMAREFGDKELWEKVCRFYMDMYGIIIEDGVARAKEAEPTIETHLEGYMFLGAVHTNFETVFNYDWSKLYKKEGM